MSHEKVEWKSNYQLGVKDIDFQHHYFVDLINRLSAVLEDADDRAYQVALIAELNAYARFHFISEENMMIHAGYPEIKEHKNHHIDLLDELSVKEAELESNHSKQEVKNIMDFLVGWFLQHSVVEDRRFADYLHTKRPPAKAGGFYRRAQRTESPPKPAPGS